MADHQYPCPECAAILRPAKPLTAGQKVKCPKCEHVFVPVPKIKTTDEATYGFAEETAAEKEADEQIKKKTLEPLLDKRPKSARGPAAAITRTPSNRMLALSIATCVSALISLLVVLFPMIFSARKFDGTELIQSWTYIFVFILAFAYSGMVTYCAIQMQNIESFRWAMTGAGLMVFPLQYGLGGYAFYWLFSLLWKIDSTLMVVGLMALSGLYLGFGVWGIITLRNATVLDGFREKRASC